MHARRQVGLLCIKRHGMDLDLARLLIDHGADVNGQNEERWTALHLASHVGHVEIAKVLIDRGANVDSWNEKQKTRLASASFFGRHVRGISTSRSSC